MAERRRSTTDPFTDLLFNALLGFTFLFLVAIMFMNPVAESGLVDPKAEIIMTVGWPDDSADDIDVWIENPHGQLVWFRNPEAGLLHLARDDRGVVNDTMEINGEIVFNPLNQEIVTLRGIVPGEYVLNLHYYATTTGQPVTATVKVEKINPTLTLIYYGTVTLEKKGDEVTAIRFTLTPAGEAHDINTLPKDLVLLG